MNEINQLKERIDRSGPDGLKTSEVRDDYEPAGNLMMRGLMETGEYVQRKLGHEWRIYKKNMAPY